LTGATDKWVGSKEMMTTMTTTTKLKLKTTTIMYKRKLNRNCTLLLWNIADDCLLPSDGESLAVSHQ
jgi:hypothetical protein